jgi:hypothetical protein
MLFSQYAQYGYWKPRVIQKHNTTASIRHLVPGGFVFLLILLALASPWWPPALWSWLTLVGLYAVCNITASCLTAARWGWNLLPILPGVFACYHFGYGYGFLRGILDFVILQRRPAYNYTKLTRTVRNHNRRFARRADALRIRQS